MKGFIMFMVGLFIGGFGMFRLISQSLDLMSTDVINSVVGIIDEEYAGNLKNVTKNANTDQLSLDYLKQEIIKRFEAKKSELQMNVATYIKDLIGSKIDSMFGNGNKNIEAAIAE